ncbi:MAG TPA: hypothetical protein VKR61_14315, partial [Bryobacteraceae bacterium]|nr:hypothetical protein [Bryobacteraceae bacterium]
MKRFPMCVAAWAMLGASAALQAQATVTLESPASPAAAEPGVTTVTLTGTGFPSGVILPAAVTVALRPVRTGNGPSGTAQATAVQPLFGSTARLTFTVPRTMVVRQSISYLVSIAGTTTAAAAFVSGNTAALAITPAASISVDPGSSASPGQSLLFTIAGSYTNFLQGATQANFGPGVSVGGAPPGEWGPLTVSGPDKATARVVISLPLSPAVNPLLVATGAEQLSYGQNFSIQNFSPVYNFLGQSGNDGANPKRVPIIGTVPGGAPSLFGVTPYGGSANFGIVYSYPLDFGTTDSVLYSFAGPPNDGETPDGSLVLAANGVLYGTTGGGGSHS